MRALKIVLRILLPLVIVALGLVAAMTLAGMRPEVTPETAEIPPPLVDVVAVEARDLTLVVATQGSVVPRNESRLTAEVSGRVEEVSPALVSGGYFETAEVLVTLDASDYELAVEEARLAVAQAELRLSQEEADADIARRDWESLGRGEASPLVLREPQVAEARAMVAAAEKRLAKSRRDVERCVVRAPYAGRVRSKGVDVGQFAERGMELGQIYAVDYAEVRLPLADAQLAYIDLPFAYRGDRDGESRAEGPPVELHARFAGRDVRWQGVIVRTEGEIDMKSRMVMVVARVEDPYGRGEDLERPPLAVGMFVDAEIRGKTVADGIALPRSALRGGKRVYVVGDDDRLHFRDVELLRSERGRIVIESGVSPGERVIVSPLETAVDGMSVRARQREE